MQPLEDVFQAAFAYVHQGTKGRASLEEVLSAARVVLDEMSMSALPVSWDAAEQLAFEALSIEGGLLSPDWLSRAAQLAAGQQSEADYRVPKGLNIRDEIGRYWRIAQAHWAEYATAVNGGADGRVVAERFVQGLLKEAFGFGSLAQVGTVTVGDRQYPIGFQALGGRVPVVIAPAGFGLDTLPRQPSGDELDGVYGASGIDRGAAASASHALPRSAGSELQLASCDRLAGSTVRS